MAIKYHFVERADNPETVGIHLDEGVFQGMVVRFDRVGFSEIEESGEAKVTFDWEILDKGPNLTTPENVLNESEWDDRLLIKQLGDIIVDILTKQLEAEDFELRKGECQTAESSQ